MKEYAFALGLTLLGCDPNAGGSDAGKSPSKTSGSTSEAPAKTGAGSAATAPAATTGTNIGPSEIKDPPIVDGSVSSDKLPFSEGASWIANGFYHLYGEVTNNTGKPVEFIKVHIDLTDDSGKTLKVDSFALDAAEEANVKIESSDFASTDPGKLMPGETALVGYLRELKKVSGTVKGHKIVKVTARPAEKVANALVKEFKGNRAPAESTVDFTGFDIEVKIEAGPNGCRSPQLILGVYAQGKLVHTANEYFQDKFQKNLAAGETAELKKNKMAWIVTKDGGGPAFGDTAKAFVRCEEVE